jgi:ubiquinone/menaquinone biosynthesis C-methylase UbiE
MNLYDRYLLPHLINLACGMKPIMRERAGLIPAAKGRVLELGIGTGLNLPYYDPSKVKVIVGVDPAAAMHPMARRRAAALQIPVETVPLVVEQIDAPAASFDTVVITFTLCTIPDPVSALREVRRVLKADGELLFCEHGRAPEISVQRWQDRLTPLWKPLAGGCHLNRDPRALLTEGGFKLHRLDMHYIPGPRPMTFLYCGSAGS